MSRSSVPKLMKSSTRRFATLCAREEFPHVAVTTKAASAVIVKESILASGIKIISRDNGAATANIKIAVMSGSRAENISEKGAAQLLAASALAGSKHFSGLRIFRTLDNNGAKVNCTADREKIVFDITATVDKLEESLTVVADAIVYPSTSAYIITEAKGTAKLAYDTLAHCPVAQLNEMLHEAAYGENTPLGGSFFSTNLAKLTPAKVQSFRQEHFAADHVVVTSNGGLSHSALQQLVELRLHGLPKTGDTHHAHSHAASGVHTHGASPFTGGDLRVRCDLDGQSYIGLGFPLPVGDAASNRVLFNYLKTHIAALHIPVTVYYHNYSTGGFFGFHTHGHAAEAKAFLHAAVTVLKAAAAGVPIEGAKVKTHLDRALALETNHAAAALLSATIAGTSAVARLDLSAVTSATVAAAATTALAATPAYAVLGTTFGTPSFADVKKMLA